MNRDYELFYIVRPDLDEEQVRAAMDAVAGLVSGQGGEVTKSSLWGRRRLAYSIAGFSDGYYALKEVRLPADRVRELERQLRLEERVIRHLVSLRQVYYLPGDEDRRGRVRGRGRDRGPGAGTGPAATEQADGAAEEPEAPSPALAERADEVATEQTPGDQEEAVAVAPSSAPDPGEGPAEPAEVAAEAEE
ncbi:MAG: 30S ribosomal protein S6 [Candidatus Dormibacteria bacterium]